MEIWLDSTNFALIGEAKEMGLLHGVTTNPSIVGASGLGLEELLEKLLALQAGPVTAQVTAAAAKQMIAQAEALHAFSERLIVKVPVTAEGLKALYALKQSGILTMATAVFDPAQALLAARSGATYVAPYFSKICENDIDGLHALKGMIALLHRYGFGSKLIAASLRSAEQVRECIEMGAHAVTLKDGVFRELVQEHPLTSESLERFAKDWKGAKPRKSLPL